MRLVFINSSSEPVIELVENRDVGVRLLMRTSSRYNYVPHGWLFKSHVPLTNRKIFFGDAGDEVLKYCSNLIN